jgi:hypothetical protein
MSRHARRRAPPPRHSTAHPLSAARTQGRDERFHESVAKYRSEDHRNDVADGTASVPDSPAAADGDLGSSDYDAAYDAALRRERQADATRSPAARRPCRPAPRPRRPASFSRRPDDPAAPPARCPRAAPRAAFLPG